MKEVPHSPCRSFDTAWCGPAKYKSLQRCNDRAVEIEREGAAVHHAGAGRFANSLFRVAPRGLSRWHVRCQRFFSRHHQRPGPDVTEVGTMKRKFAGILICVLSLIGCSNNVEKPE